MAVQPCLKWIPIFRKNCLTQTIALNSRFQFDNLLQSNLHCWCGTVWCVTEPIYVLTVFLNSELLFSANLNFSSGRPVLLPCKNSGPFHHVLQPDNPTISIPQCPISSGFILPLTKFHWVGSDCGVNFTNFISYKRTELLTFSNIYPFFCCQGIELLQTISLLCLKYLLEADHPNQSLKSIYTSCIRISALTTNDVTSLRGSNSVQILLKSFLFVKTIFFYQDQYTFPQTKLQWW